MLRKTCPPVFCQLEGETREREEEEGGEEEGRDGGRERGTHIVATQHADDLA
jgi:hypothetical protein